MANDIQEPQSVLVDKNSEYGVQESLILSILSEVTLTFKGFDFDAEKFRIVWIDQSTQEARDEVLTLDIQDITEPNPDYDNNLPTSDTNQPNITYKIGTWIFSEQWLKEFYNNNFNGRTANFNIEIFHLNAAFKQVVDYTIATSLLDNAIVTPIQGLVPLPFNNPFADIGIRSAVQQETPEGSDELSWKSGYTEPYQRPTNRDGKWIKMGQYNQILYDISKSALTLQDNLSILAKYINDEIDVKLDDVRDFIEVAINTPPKDAVLITDVNQTAAGLKNFTGVNINNFKTSPQAVANLEFCNGLPINNFVDFYKWNVNINYTMAGKNQMWLFINYSNCALLKQNNYIVAAYTGVNSQQGTQETPMFMRNKDIFIVTRDCNTSYSGSIVRQGA